MNLYDSYLPPSSLESEKWKQLSVGIAYYVRKLLRQNLDQLTFVVATGASIKADPLNDLNAVIKSLYLENVEIEAIIRQLEHLALFHQSLSSQGAKYRQELKKTEEQIFWLLGFKLRDTQQQGNILIVDDTPMNVHLLTTALTRHGYGATAVMNGALALTTAIETGPDLILLDILMPGLDGYEVCKQLKSDAQTRDIPVVFISAINSVSEKVKAFEVGGADYIPKPFQIEEVLARVENQMNLRSLQKRLTKQNERLQQEIQERRTAEALYRSMFENSVDGIFQTTPNGQYLRANPALARIYGYTSPDELIATINNVAQQLYVQPERRNEFLIHMKQTETVIDFESQIYRKDGTIIWISENVHVVKDVDGTALLFEGTVKDITAIKTSTH